MKPILSKYAGHAVGDQMRNRIKYNHEVQQIRAMRRQQREFAFWVAFGLSVFAISLGILVFQ